MSSWPQLIKQHDVHFVNPADEQAHIVFIELMAAGVKDDSVIRFKGLFLLLSLFSQLWLALMTLHASAAERRR